MRVRAAPVQPWPLPALLSACVDASWWLLVPRLLLLFNTTRTIYSDDETL
jgi:hypothetical protein